MTTNQTALAIFIVTFIVSLLLALDWTTIYWLIKHRKSRQKEKR